MKCASKQDEIISSSQNFLKGKNVNKAGKIPTLPKRRDCQQSVSRLICGLVHISEMMFPKKNVRFIAVNNGVDSANPADNDFTPFLNIMKNTRHVEKARGRGRFVVSLSPYSALFVFFARISLLFAEKGQTKTGRR